MTLTFKSQDLFIITTGFRLSFAGNVTVIVDLFWFVSSYSTSHSQEHLQTNQ